MSNYLQADANGSFDIYGSGLTLSNPTPCFTGTRYNLFGKLQDSTPINLFAYSCNNGQFRVHNLTTAPEPSLAAALGIGILGLGALALRARRRARV